MKNREIKFRGKRIDNGGWVYGYFVMTPTGQSRIYWKPFAETSTNTYHIIHSVSVGQFTGLYSTQGVEIYEGDIVKYTRLRTMGDGFITYNVTMPLLSEFSEYLTFKLHAKETEIIGNIYENPELL